MSSPSINALPLEGVSNAPIMCMAVDFPEPEGPISDMNSPLFIFKFIMHKDICPNYF